MAAKILLLDIETAPSVGYVWGKYDQNVIEFQRDWYVLSFAYKWLEDTGVTVRALPDYKGYKAPGNDVQLITDLRDLLDAADIVVAHNGDAFDIKKIAARCLIHKIPPPSDFKTFDTLKELRKNFKLDSNKLSDVGKSLGIGGKLSHTGFALWMGCMEGDRSAWKVMKEYNAQDVVLLEEVYLRIRPWCSHPDVNIYGGVRPVVGRVLCPTCGSDHTQRRGTAIARTRTYQRWNCQQCGAWFQGELEK